MYQLRGIVPAMVTPFNKEDKIDEAVLRKLLHYYTDAGCQALGVGGSTSEYIRMTQEERKQILAIAMDEIKGKNAVIAGTGCHRVQDTIALTQYAEELGADAALIITPYYMHITDEAMVEYYKTIARNTGIAIVLYSWPEATNVRISPQVVKELAGVKNIVGIKNSDAQDHTNALIKLTEDEDFSVFTGEETFLLPTLACGGTGMYGLMPNVIPKLMVEWYNAVTVEKNLDKGREMHNRFLPLYELLISEPVPAVVKAALNLLGFDVGVPRLPIQPASEQAKQKLQQLLTEYGCL